MIDLIEKVAVAGGIITLQRCPQATPQGPVNRLYYTAKGNQVQMELRMLIH